jgi:hypothetical protein
VSDKADAQRRADQIAAFRAEVTQLTHEGVGGLDPAVLAAIRSHHDLLLARLAREFDVDTTLQAKRMSRGMQVAALLGACALTAAVVSFVYRVWGVIPEAAQVALLTAAPLAAVAAMLVAARIEQTLYVASLFAIVACAAFVLQTVVLGQLFNMRASPHALGMWAAFAFAIAVPGRFLVPFAWALAALVAYMAALAMSAADVAWTSFPQRPETIVAAAAVVWAGSTRWPNPFRPVTRSLALVLLLAPVLVLSSTGTPSVLPFDAGTIRVLYQLGAVAAAAAAIGIGLRRGYNDALIIGAIFAGLFILTRFVDWWWDWMPRYLFFLILAALAIGWLWLLRAARRRLEGSRA